MVERRYQENKSDTESLLLFVQTSHFQILSDVEIDPTC